MTEIPLHEMRSGRRIPAPVEWALNSALSRGPGYEPTPIGRAFDDRSVSGYYIDFSAKTTAPTAQATDTMPATPLIQLALGWWERHVAGDPGALERFLDVCRLVEGRASAVGEELRWPIRVAVPKYRLAPGWCSALPQGQAASVFVRAHLATGEDRYADMASRAVAPLMGEARSELVTWTAQGPILEEAPSNPPSHVLNGWISALWGLWDVHLGLEDPAAGRAVEAGVDCLVALLPAFDAGWWSLYSLFPHAVEDLAKPIYHRFHVDQLEVLHRLTGRAELAATRDRWNGYDGPVRRGLVLAHKALFTALEAPRRRRWSSGRAPA